MNTVTGKVQSDQVRIVLSGRIDSNNAAQTEAAMNEIADGQTLPLVIDAEKLDYISSAGLRVLLRLRKKHTDLTVTGVNSEVYEILEMTGFTELMTVEKAYRVVSVEGAEEIGRGANGTIYRIDQDNVVKVYNNADALEEIRHEREVARLALVLGIPTAISYDVVRVGDSYGSVFELLNARSFSKILANEPEQMDWCVHEYVTMLRKIHSTLVPAGKLPDMRETAIGWAEFVKPYLPEAAGEKLLSLVKAVPHDDHMIHGDYHTKNLELQGDEVLLIDMDTLAVGHPVFELGSIYNAFVGFSEYDHETVRHFQGFDYKTSTTFWHKSLAAYLGTEDEEIVRQTEDKARIIGYTRLIRRAIRRNGLESEESRREIDLWKGELLELLDRTDSLLFLRNELEIPAETERLPEVLSFIEQHLEHIGCGPRAVMQVSVVAEEVFVNIASYAYAPGKGKALIRAETGTGPKQLTLTFIDWGTPFDPLTREDPDLTLPAEDREIGGLGILMTKKMMDEASYTFKDGQNILVLKKYL